MYSYGVNYVCYLRWNLMTLFRQLASLIQWNRSRVFEEYFSKLSIFRTKSRFPLIYSRTTLFRSPKGNEKKFEIAGLRNNRGSVKGMGKCKGIRSSFEIHCSGDFELTEFEIARFDFTWFCPWFFEPSIFGNSGRDFTNKFCFLSKICTRFLEPENSGAKKNWS